MHLKNVTPKVSLSRSSIAIFILFHKPMSEESQVERNIEYFKACPKMEMLTPGRFYRWLKARVCTAYTYGPP